jgi:Fe2+ transport system protein FeoA
MKPFNLLMGRKVEAHIPTVHERFRQEVEDRLKDFGLLPQCQLCRKHCKLPSAPHLTCFVCTSFQIEERKRLTFGA